MNLLNVQFMDKVDVEVYGMVEKVSEFFSGFMFV